MGRAFHRLEPVGDVQSADWGGKSCSFLIGVVSVIARHSPVRGVKSRPCLAALVGAPRGCAGAGVAPKRARLGTGGARCPPQI